MSPWEYVSGKFSLDLFIQNVHIRYVHCMCHCAFPVFRAQRFKPVPIQNLKYISLVQEAGNLCKENAMPNSASNSLTLTLANQQSNKTNGFLMDMHTSLREPACPNYVLQKFKKGVTSVIDIEVIRKILDTNFPINLPSVLLRRYWLDKVSSLNDWDRQLIQNQICNSFYDIFYIIDNVRPYTDVLHQSTSLDIAQAIVKITAQQSQQQAFSSLQQWFGYSLDMVHECEPNIINQLRFAHDYIKEHGERRFHVTAYKKNYVVYGGWRRNKTNKPSFELLELLNSTIGFENFHLHKIHAPLQLKKAASLLKHFRKMVIRSGGKELLLSDSPEMSDFGTRAYVREVVTPSMLSL